MTTAAMMPWKVSSTISRRKATMWWCKARVMVQRAITRCVPWPWPKMWPKVDLNWAS